MARVRVPQADGEITVTRGNDRHTYRVSDHEVTVATDRLEHFLRSVAGSKQVSEASPRTKPDTGKEG